MESLADHIWWMMETLTANQNLSRFIGCDVHILPLVKWWYRQRTSGENSPPLFDKVCLTCLIHYPFYSSSVSTSWPVLLECDSVRSIWIISMDASTDWIERYSFCFWYQYVQLLILLSNTSPWWCDSSGSGPVLINSGHDVECDM